MLQSTRKLQRGGMLTTGGQLPQKIRQTLEFAPPREAGVRPLPSRQGKPHQPPHRRPSNPKATEGREIIGGDHPRGIPGRRWFRGWLPGSAVPRHCSVRRSAMWKRRWGVRGTCPPPLPNGPDVPTVERWNGPSWPPWRRSVGVRMNLSNPKKNPDDTVKMNE